MSKHARVIEIDRASVDAENGTFEAVVFSGGEASDGHRLNMTGASIPKKLPLFVNHQADPRTQLGSLHHLRTDGDEAVFRGEIFLGGEGDASEIRRDIVAKMAAGHVGRMSGRWDAEDVHITRRTELDKEHPAYVGKQKAERDFRYRYGYFFDKWRALEGSVVGLGADPSAVMRWAQDETSSEAVRHFWRDQIDPESEPYYTIWNDSDTNLHLTFSGDEALSEEAVEKIVRKLFEEHPEKISEPEDEEPEEAPEYITREEISGLVDDLAEIIRAEVQKAVEALASPPEVEDPPEEPTEEEEPEGDPELLQKIAALEARLGEFEKLKGLPPSMGPAMLIRHIEKTLAGERKAAVQKFRDYVAYQRGEIINGDEKMRTVRELKAVVRAMAEKGRVPADPPPAPTPGMRVIAENLRGLPTNARNLLRDYLARLNEADEEASQEEEKDE